MKKIEKTKDYWPNQLGALEFEITRNAATERAFSGRFWSHFEAGIYRCVCCRTPLFLSDSKFDAGCGWPSFFEPINREYVREQMDTSHKMVRTEILCNVCDAHLGHVFSDGPPPTGLRYCINSVALCFVHS